MAVNVYNKNNSRVKELKVSRSYIDLAERYWTKVNEVLEVGLPPIKEDIDKPGLVPVENWECNKKYCSFFVACGGGIKGMK